MRSPTQDLLLLSNCIIVVLSFGTLLSLVIIKVNIVSFINFLSIQAFLYLGSYTMTRVKHWKSWNSTYCFCNLKTSHMYLAFSLFQFTRLPLIIHEWAGNACNLHLFTKQFAHTEVSNMAQNLIQTFAWKKGHPWAQTSNFGTVPNTIYGAETSILELERLSSKRNH